MTHAELLQRIDSPHDLHEAQRGRAPAGRAGGSRAHHRHRGRDRRSFRRQPRRPARSRSRSTRCSTPRGTRSSGMSATRPTRTRSSPAGATSSRRSASTRDWLRSARSRVRARHHGRRPRLDGHRLCGRDQGGDASGHGEDGQVVAVVGDGAMTGGVAFEAVHQAGGERTPIVVVLNDNGMSIAPNVGALSRYFNRIRLNPKLWHAREGFEDGLTKLPAGVGSAFERFGPHVKESIKAFWAPGLWWEELDFAYMGVIDGHDVRGLRRALREALAADRPVVVHCAPSRARASRPLRRAASRAWRSGTPRSPTRSSTDAGAGRQAARRPRRRRSRRASSSRPAVHAGVRRGDGAPSAVVTSG